MAYEFKKIAQKDIGKGHDQRSAPNALLEGFAERLTNVDVNSNGFISKRAGFQGHYGYLPIRVESIEHSGTEIKFNLHGGINTASIVSTPIVVYGKLSGAQSGDWSTTNNAEYYTGFTTDIPDTLDASDGTKTLSEARHGVNTDNVFLGCLLSTSLVNNSNEYVLMDRADINQADPFDVDFTYTIPSDTDAFLFVSDKDTVGGDSYVHNETVNASTTATISIPTASHALDNFNIIGQVFYEDSSEWVLCEPDSFQVDMTTGDVTISFVNGSASPVNVQVVLSAAPVANAASQTISAGTTADIVLSGEEDNFFYLSVYSVSAGVLTRVIPDSIVRDDDADTITVSITNGAGSSQSFMVFYEFASLTTSTIIVEDNGAVSTSYTDSAPQLTLWGIPHTHYTTSEDQEGHVVHIDSYKRDGEERLVAGLGGNIFTAKNRSEAAAYLIPSSEISIENRIGSDTDLAPAFDVTGSTVTRTRGIVTGDEVDSDNRALVTAVSYVSSGVARYTLTLTNKVGSLATAISTSSTLPDYLTVTGMANAIHNGTFQITAVDNTANTITVANSAVTMADWDETGAQGRAGIYTDQIPLASTSDFLVGDTVESSVIDLTTTVKASYTTTVVVDGVTEEISLAAGVRLFGARNASVIPVNDVDNFVRGDMLTVTGLVRQPRVKYVNPYSNRSITSIVGSGTAATVTMGSAHNLTLGQKVLILRSGNSNYDGEKTVASIPTTTTFTFSSTATASVAAGIIKGDTIELDEVIAVEDNGAAPTTFSVVGRWIPVEAPTTSDGLPETTYIRHFDADSYLQQEIARSVMVNDSMYFTNYADEVMKFDGTSLYQAGLIRWQPQLFAQVDTTTASLATSRAKMNYSAIDSDLNKFTVDSTVLAQPGDVFVDEDTSISLTVESVDDENKFLYVVEDTSGVATGGDALLRKATSYNYYFRLNAIDENQNVVASAVTGATDCQIYLTAAGQIHIRMLRPPVLSNYDYDKLEIQVYRTKKNTVAPFYLNRTVDVTFSTGSGYIDVYDGTPDESLTELDNVNTILKGAELGTAWTQPLRAKYMTSAKNKLILGNIKDYPELDIVLRKKSSAPAISAADLSGKRFLFRKDSTDTGTTCNMVDRVGLEFVNSGAVTIDPATDIATTATTFTITENAHGLVAGNWVYLFHNAAGADNELQFTGWWQINSADTNTFTIKHDNGYTATAADVDRYVAATTKTDIPVYIGTDGNRNWTDANTIDEFTAMLRLSEAFNAAMVNTDVTVSGYGTFVPWATANAGSEYGPGRVVVRQEKVMSTTMEVLLPAAVTTGDWFVGEVKRTASTEIAASTRVFPSRVLISYEAYPEIFDNPYGDQASSDSVIDVNAADGQEITGVIPFFGDAVFGSGQMEDVVVVFKTNSIYLLNIETKEITKIQSRGLGCTAPRSIAPTKDGIAFANTSGVYKLTPDQKVVPIGKNIERIWQDEVNLDAITAATGHNYGIGSKYKLSVPVGDDQETNNRVLVYDYEREGRDQEYGAWTEYTNHNATGWANLGTNAFFATTDGQVFKIRNVGDETDFRDDASAVAEMVILLKAEDFGVSSSRKIVQGIVSHFHMRHSDMVGTTLYTSKDLDGTFTSAGTFTLEKDATVKVLSVVSSVNTRRCTYIQPKYVNSTKDEGVVLAGIDYNVTLLDVHGIRDQAEN